MSKVLIVSKTRMTNNHVCVGGVDLDNSSSVRLLDCNGYHELVSDCPYNIRDVWDIDYCRSPRPLPHSEDVKVIGRNRLGVLRDDVTITNILKQKKFPIYEGSINNCFEGKMRCTNSGTLYICEDDIPRNSTCFWICDHNIKRRDFQGKIRYNYNDFSRQWGYNISYVGLDTDPINIIKQGSLVRLSLAHWWSPTNSNNDKRCYLQISGWY